MKIISLIVILALCAAPAFVLISQLLARRRSQASQRPPWRWELTSAGREVLVLWGVGWLWPFQMLRRRWSRHRSQGTKTPVVMVPGYMESDTLLIGLRRRLRRSGRSYATYKYAPLFGDGPAQAQRLGRFIDEVKGRFDVEQVDLIAHSFGGLLCRHLLQTEGYPGIRKLVCLAVPHRGTQLAHLALGPAGRDLLPGSQFTTNLATAGPMAAACLDLWAPCDGVVHPRENAAYDESSQRIDGAWGHNGMLFARETGDRILSFLDSELSPEQDPR